MAQELSPARARELIPEEALAQVPGYGPVARIAALEGGAVNKTFRVETPIGRFVLRLHGAIGVTALGASHIREAYLQNAAAVFGIAPAVVHVDAQQRFMISEYVEGRVWAPQDFSNVARLRQLGGTLRKLHEIVPPIPAPFDLAALLQDFATQIARAAPAEAPQLAQWMAHTEVSLRECGTKERAPKLFHSDLQHSNIIESEGRLLLIDWEYAAVGDPLFDLACVLAYYPQAAPYAQELLEASGLAGQATPAMLEHATRLYVLLSFLWERSRRLAASSSASVGVPTPAD